MTIQFSYEKKKVIQALRHHFLSRPEIRAMIIVVNVFALISAVLFYLHKILPFAFLVGSFLWLVLMITVWYIMPMMVYRKSHTFKDHFSMTFQEDGFTWGNERGGKKFGWNTLSKFMETPYFFYFYFNAQAFFLIPKSGFGDSDEVHQLRQLLKEKVRK